MSTPAVFAASRIDMPSGTVTGRPSIVSEIIFTSAICASRRRGATERRGNGDHATRGDNLRLELAAELLEARYDRRCARIAEHADRLATHVVGNGEQRVE